MTTKNKKPVLTEKRVRELYVGFLLLLSLSIALMPAGTALKDKSMLLMYLCGAAFWIGLAGVIVMAVQLIRQGKGAHGSKKLPAALLFFTNKSAKVADTVMLVSLLGVILTRAFKAPVVASFLLLAVLIFSFGMHCILNRKPYSSKENQGR